MKKFKKLISLSLVLMMIVALSVNCFAAEYDSANGINYVFELRASSDSVSVGDTVRVNYYLYDKAEGGIEFPADQTANFIISYNPELFKVVATQEKTVNEEVINTDISGQVIYFLENKVVNFTNDTPFFYVDFEAIAEGTDTFDILSTDEDGYTTVGEVYLMIEPDLDLGDGQAVNSSAVEVAAAGEEEFTVENELATGDKMMTKDSSGNLVEVAADATDAKVLAVFAKTVETGLDAESYGIVFGGVKYPGKLAVEANQSWAIKLIIPNGMLEKGSYDYGTYVGSAEPVIAANPFVVD